MESLKVLESHPTADAKIADPGGESAGPSPHLENLPVLWSMPCIYFKKTAIYFHS